jgi:hypothetical protein
MAPGVVVEHVGDDVVVLVPGSTEVMKLSGGVAHTIRSIQAGATSVLPSETVSELVDRGIIVSRAGMSRRGLIKAGAIGASAGIAVMAMPGVAAASSNTEAPIQLLQNSFARQFDAYTQSPNLQNQQAIVLVSAVVTVDNGIPEDAIGFSLWGVGEGVDKSDVVSWRFASLPSGTITRLEVRFTWENVPFWAVYTPA